MGGHTCHTEASAINGRNEAERSSSRGQERAERATVSFLKSIIWERVVNDFQNTLQSLTFHTTQLPYSQPFGFSDKK